MKELHLLLNLLFIGWCSVVSALPAGFLDEEVARVADATTAAFATDQILGLPMLIVTSKDGRLFAIQNLDSASPSRSIILDMTDRVCSNGERGLQSIAVHPNFDENKYIYLFYTQIQDGQSECYVDDSVRGPLNKVVRVKVGSDNMVDISTEEVLFTTGPLVNFYHNGGAMAFGVDGSLYFTLGDGGDHADGYSQLMNTALGKVLRITDDGGIPTTNPHTGDGTARCNAGEMLAVGQVCQEIHSVGLRNPFRISMDTNSLDTVKFVVGDVGGNVWDTLHEGVPGNNYGWPIREGPCLLGSLTTCASGEPVFNDPFYYYPHDDDGGAIVAGAFVPDDSGWPSEFMGGFMYADFVSGDINLLQQTDDGCATCVPPIPQWSNTTFHVWPRPVFLIFGPYQGGTALYYITREGSRNVRRIDYLGGDNNSPIASVVADTTSGEPPLVITFDGSGSTDPDGNGITYQWDLDDAIVSSDSSVTLTFDNPGVYIVTLTVRDPSGFDNTNSTEIHVGTPPVAIMDSPANGTMFAVGDIFQLSGQALDVDGNALTTFTMSWEVRQHHLTHFHPFMGITEGNDLTMQPAPQPEDFLAATNSYLEVLLTVVNENGLSSVVSRNIMPKTRYMFVDSVPPGLELLIADYPITTPATVTVWENDEIIIEAADQAGLTFVSWNDGGASEHNITITTDNALSYLATFQGGPPTPTAPTSATAAPVTTPPVTTTAAPASSSPGEDVTSAPFTGSPLGVTGSPIVAFPESSPPTTVQPNVTTSAPAIAGTSAPVTVEAPTVAPTKRQKVSKAPIGTEPPTASAAAGLQFLSWTLLTVVSLYWVLY